MYIETTSIPCFSLVRRAKRARHENDHVRDERREKGEAFAQVHFAYQI